MRRWFLITTAVTLFLQGISTQAMEAEEVQMSIPVHFTSLENKDHSFPASVVSWTREQAFWKEPPLFTKRQRLLRETVLRVTKAEIDIVFYAQKNLGETKPLLEPFLTCLKQPALLVENSEEISSVHSLEENGERHFRNFDALVSFLEEEKKKMSLHDPDHLLFEDLIYYYTNYKKTLLEAHSLEQLKESLTPKVRLTGDHLGVYLIPQKTALSLSWKDMYGYTLRKTNKSGNHRVLGRDGVHFKLSNDAHTEEGGVNELCPGAEYAVSSLCQLLDPRIAPPSCLLVLHKQRFYQLPPNHPFTIGINQFSLESDMPVEVFFNRNPDVKQVLDKEGIILYKESRFLQGSLTAGDMGLYDFLKQSQKDPSLLNKIDRPSFSALCIAALLINPSDWKPGNFRVQIERDSEKNIKSAVFVAIDNDDALVPSIIPLYRTGHSVGPKNVLYFFKELMDEPIDSHFREDFLKKSPEALFLEWVNTMEEQNKRYASLHPEGVLSERNLQNLSLPIGFLPGTLVKMYEKLVNIHECMSKSKTVSHTTLFRDIDPVVFYYYDKLMRCPAQKLLSIVDAKDPSAVKHYEALLNEETCRPLLLIHLLYGQGSLTTLSIEDICNLNHSFKIGNKYFTLDEILEDIKPTQGSRVQRETEAFEKSREEVLRKIFSKQRVPSRRALFMEKRLATRHSF